MKWPPSKGYQNQNIQRNSNPQGYISHSTSQIAKIIICFVCTGIFLSGDSDRLKATVSSASSPQLAKKISQIATDISVRILSEDFLGSGFILQRNNQEYLVITNQHVLRAGEPPYVVETVDGNTYKAEVVSEPINSADSQEQYDLAILKFVAQTEYKTAKVGNSGYLDVGERVFAAGFPAQELISPKTSAIFPQPNIFSPRKLSLKPGRVSIILNQSLVEGYQIGYTNDVKKGMSGGALLNSQGEVVGINGKHAYPLWESPEMYQDGSEPCSALQEVITRSSLAIPIEKTMALKTQKTKLDSQQLPTELDIPSKSLLPEQERRLISKMQAQAENVQQQCRRENNSTVKF